MSIKNKLNRLKPHLSNESNKMKQENAIVNTILEDMMEIPFMDVWRQEGCQSLIIRMTIFALSEK